MWTDGNGFFYDGDQRAGDREATQAELRAWRLSRARDEKREALGTEFARRNAEGFLYLEHRFQLDDASQGRITALALLAQSRPDDWPAGFAFIAADNEPVPMQPAGFVDFAAAAALAVIARRLRVRALKDAIRDAASLTALNAIDLTSGWE